MSKMIAPPQGKTDWPWVPSSENLSKDLIKNKLWPKISIVTPNYNQGQFIEETIRSILLQDYPNLEYIIINGGSTDNSVEIIKKYEQWLTYWVSEADSGQTNALNKGFEKATGDLIAWMNADDIYMPGALIQVGQSWINNKKKDNIFIYGNAEIYNELRGISNYRNLENFSVDILSRESFFCSASSFFTKEHFEHVGRFDESLHYGFDFDFWIRLTEDSHNVHIPHILAKCRIHDDCKSGHSRLKFFIEDIHIVERYSFSKRVVAYRIRNLIREIIQKDNNLIGKSLVAKIRNLFNEYEEYTGYKSIGENIFRESVGEYCFRMCGKSWTNFNFKALIQWYWCGFCLLGKYIFLPRWWIAILTVGRFGERIWREKV